MPGVTALIDRTFSLVSYADRWRYLRLTHSIRSQAAMTAASTFDPITSPAVLALTLPHTQRVTAMRAQRALFLSSFFYRA
eukprot:SAG11_NODE_6799_length_1246_cov_2.418483_1_plen_79_part_10